MLAYRSAVVGLYVALGLFLWASLARSATLTCTAPTSGQRWSRVFDPEIGDSTNSVDCGGGPALHDSMWVTLWRQPLTGGGYSPSDSAFVAPGDSVRFFSVGPGHYYAIARNGIGQSCVTQAPVYVPPPVVTGIPTEPEAGDVVLVRLFRVSGQQVATLPGTVWDRLWKENGVMERSLLLRAVTQGRLAAGVYFARAVTRSGTLLREGTKKVVMLR